MEDWQSLSHADINQKRGDMIKLEQNSINWKKIAEIRIYHKLLLPGRWFPSFSHSKETKELGDRICTAREGKREQ